MVFALLVPEAGELLLLSDRGYAKRCLLVDYEVQRPRRQGRAHLRLQQKRRKRQRPRLRPARDPLIPGACSLTQADRTETVLTTEEILIEGKAGRGKTRISPR